MSQCDAIVVAVEGERIWVEVPPRASACGSCKSPDECHTGMLGRMAKPRRYQVDAACAVRVGDRVSLQVADGVLWQASWGAYLLPVLLLLGGATLGQMAAGGGGAAVGTLLALAVGFALLRQRELRARHAHALISLHPKQKEVRFVQERS
ncbi:MAG: hypothetical protein CVU17_09335 [Betaproteobacteria bacterium HGW-Betaproteobacteria-11]|nr:MAG: hypothetical protein CVU17_09335 [Betaproteobacteria bacterium HGW-Betaproteobacteria-11]